MLEKKTMSSYLVLPFLLPAPPTRGVKRPRLSAAAALQKFFMSFEVTTLLFNFVYYISFFSNCLISYNSNLVILGRLPKVDLIILERGENVRPYVRPSTKNFFDLNEIWYIGRGRWEMHDGMPYGRIQGQGHEPLKVWIPCIFKTYLLRHLQWELATDH